jgi:hypothetical protein
VQSVFLDVLSQCRSQGGGSYKLFEDMGIGSRFAGRLSRFVNLILEIVIRVRPWLKIERTAIVGRCIIRVRRATINEVERCKARQIVTDQHPGIHTARPGRAAGRV